MENQIDPNNRGLWHKHSPFHVHTAILHFLYPFEAAHKKGGGLKRTFFKFTTSAWKPGTVVIRPIMACKKFRNYAFEISSHFCSCNNAARPSVSIGNNATRVICCFNLCYRNRSGTYYANFYLAGMILVRNNLFFWYFNVRCSDTH